MSAWGQARGGPLLAADEHAIVQYMRSWQKAPAALLDERPLAGNAKAGAAIYEQQCLVCHGEKGMHGWFEGVSNPELIAAASNGFLRYSIAHGRSETAMSGYTAMI